MQVNMKSLPIGMPNHTFLFSIAQTISISMDHVCVFATTGKRVTLRCSHGDDVVATLQAQLGAMTLLDPAAHRLERQPAASPADVSTEWAVALRVSGGKGGFGKTLEKKGRNYRYQQSRRETAAPAVAAYRNLDGQRVEAGAAAGGDRQFSQYRRTTAAATASRRKDSDDEDDEADGAPGMEERDAAAVERAVEGQRVATKRRVATGAAGRAQGGFPPLSGRGVAFFHISTARRPHSCALWGVPRS